MNLLATIASMISLPLATPIVFGPEAHKRFGATLRLEDREMPRTPWHYRLTAPVWVIAPRQEQIEEADLPVMGAKFGRFGNRSICDRVWIEIEHATRFADHYTLALLPASYFDPNHEDDRRNRILRVTHAEVLRMWIDGALLGEPEPSCLIIWRRTVNKMPGALIWRVRKEEDFERAHTTMRTHGWQPYLMKLHEALKEKPIVLPTALEPQKGRPVVTIPLTRRDTHTASLAERPLLRACVHGGGQSVIFKPMNTAARTLIESLRGAAKIPIIHSETEPKVIGYTQTDRLLLRLNMLARYPQLLDRKIDHLRAQGADVEEAHDLRPWLEKRLRQHQRLNTVPFEQTVRLEDGGWDTLYEATGVRSVHQHNYNDFVKRATALPWKKWGFHNDDLARMMIKGSALYVADQGTGKTRFTLSLVRLRSAKLNLIVLEARLVQEFLNEVKAIGFPRSEVHVIEDAEDARPEKLKRINLVAYSRLGRGVVSDFPPTKRRNANQRLPLRGASPSEGRRRALPADAVKAGEQKGNDEPYKRTLAHVLRQTRFNTLFCDEGHKLANSGAQQTQAVALLRAKHVIVMSGTPIKNYPDGALALWLRTAGERTTLCPYSDNTPILLDHEHRAMSGRKRYMDLFVSYKTVTSQFTGKKSRRKVPLIPDESLDLWRDQLSYIMCRRSMHEPEVASEIPLPKSDIDHILEDMHDHHVNFYHWWLDQFFEWLQNQMQLEAAGRSGGGAGAIFAQLGKLDFATGFPQAPQLQIQGAPEWGDTLTTKQITLLDRLTVTAPQGYKSIVFGMHPDFLELMREELEDRSIKTAMVHGAITMTKRNDDIKRYRTDDNVNVLLASFDAANTGYNIPEADVVYCYDWPWQPSTMDQAEKRMIRPGWLTEERKASGAQPMIRRMVQTGGLDEYKRQLVYLKAQGADQAINRQQAEFDAESWLGYRDFSIKMLRDRGYKI